MSPQINLVWVAIVAGLYFVAWRLLAGLAKRLEPRRWRWYVIAPIAAAVLAAPWVDELWIAWRFGELCKDAGLQVKRKVEVDGYLVSPGTSSSLGLKETLIADPQTIERFDQEGYRYKETLLSDGKVWIVERTASGLKGSVQDQPRSRYHFKTIRDHADAGYQLEAFEYVVVDSHNEEVIGRQLLYNRYPGWVNGLWIRFLGSGMTRCPHYDERSPPQPPFFPQSILIPTRSR